MLIMNTYQVRDNIMKSIKCIVLSIALLLIPQAFCVQAGAAELLSSVQKIVPLRDGQTPQAPRVSPDGKKIIFEYYSKERVSLWLSDSNGKGAVCLTCKNGKKLENGSWHPSGDFILFNEVPEGNLKNGNIYVARLKGSSLSDITQVDVGARPQFSKPNGHVIFFETGNINTNILAYKILGANPLSPPDEIRLELRGPIQQVNSNSEVSHPFLAPDGTTIIFTARSTNLSYRGLELNDINRQKLYKFWKTLLKVDRAKIDKELASFGQYVQGDSEFTGEEYTPAIGNESQVSANDVSRINGVGKEFLDQPTIVAGYTKKDLFMAWVVGLLNSLDENDDLDVQNLIYPRLWITDVFGAPIEPLVRNLASTSLPQKWPTVSHDGRFVVFEAGHWTNRHIYLVMKKGDTWMDSAVKLTEKGSYNSSPEIDPTGKWLYFESNRDGKKGIWKAKLDWTMIEKKLAEIK